MKISETYKKLADPGVILALTAVLYSMTPVHNGNFFWHLRNGIDILETGQIRTEDPFTWTRQGAEWIQHEWLAESAMALSWLHIGETGPVILKALFIGLSVFLAFRAAVRNGGNPAFAFLFGAAWLMLAQPRWIARPHFFSIFFFSLYLYILSGRIEKPWKLALVLLPIQVIWVNVHAGFVMGIFLASVPALSKLLNREWKTALNWLLPPLVLIGASGIHPNGFKTLEYLPSFLAQPLYKETIREWWSPFDARYAPLKLLSRTAVILVSLVVSTGIITFLFKKTVERGRIAALAILTAATVFAARNGELLAPAMLAWIPGMIRLKSPRKAILLPALVLLAVPFLYGVPREVGPPRHLGAGVDWNVYPVKLADILESRPEMLERAILFNTNEISGYLEYRFGEKLPLFMDGRCLIFPESFYREYLSLCFATEPNYLNEQYRMFTRYGFNLLIYNTLEPGSSVYLAAALPEWVPVYIDDLTAVYAERDFLRQSNSEDLGFHYFDPFDPEEFFEKPLYLLPCRALEELRLQSDQMGTDILSYHIAALEFRCGLTADIPEDMEDGTAGYTLRCWKNCREGNLQLAAENAILSEDQQLVSAVRILGGEDLNENEYLLGIRSSGMVRSPGAVRAVETTALWVTGQQALALRNAEMHLDSMPGWGIAQCGMLYSLAGDSETALRLADLALETRRGPVVLERAARIHWLENNYGLAAELCNEALVMSPGFSGARLLLGDCLWSMSMVTEARIEYETIIQSGYELPEYAKQRLELAELLSN